MINIFNLTDKNALITGAAGLLGFQHTVALIKAGANVILTDVDMKKLASNVIELEKMGFSKQIRFFFMDVTRYESIKEVFDALVLEGVAVNILINNAAVDPKVNKNKSLDEASRFENFPLDQWNFQLSVGLTGAFLCSQIFGSEMARKDLGGVILNIASDLSVFAPDNRIYRIKDLEENMQPVKPITYSVIKTALIGMTKYLAVYWADKNIRVNALSPGGVYNDQPDEFVTKLSTLIPMGRMAKKDEYQGAIQFLCSDASTYMTGQNIVIDGGRSVW